MRMALRVDPEFPGSACLGLISLNFSVICVWLVTGRVLAHREGDSCLGGASEA
jgi:hypothetical protein